MDVTIEEGAIDVVVVVVLLVATTTPGPARLAVCSSTLLDVSARVVGIVVVGTATIVDVGGNDSDNDPDRVATLETSGRVGRFQDGVIVRASPFASAGLRCVAVVLGVRCPAPLVEVL